MGATKLRIGSCAIAHQKSSKRLFLRKSHPHPLLKPEQRSRSKRNKWRGPNRAQRKWGRNPFMPDWFLSVAEGSADPPYEPKNDLTPSNIINTKQRAAGQSRLRPSLRTGLADLLHPALQSVVNFQEDRLTHPPELSGSFRSCLPLPGGQ